MNREKLEASIMAGEGTGPVRNGRLMPYRDSLGNLSLGYGRNIDDNGISAAEAAMLLGNDIDISIATASQQPWFGLVEPCEPRLRAICEILFELGLPRFNGFHDAVAALNAGDWQTAGAEFLNSLWHLQVGKRAERLAAMIQTGKDEVSGNLAA